MTASAKKILTPPVKGVNPKSAPKTISAAKRKSNSASKKEAMASVSSSEIDDQVKAFLQKGGKIDKIANGISGQPTGQLPTRKHIVISKK